MVPAAEVKAPPFIEYSPPTIEIAVAAVIPLIVTAGEVTIALGSALVELEKLKVLGVVSWGATELVVITLDELEPSSMLD